MVNHHFPYFSWSFGGVYSIFPTFFLRTSAFQRWLFFRLRPWRGTHCHDTGLCFWSVIIFMQVIAGDPQWRWWIWLDMIGFTSWDIVGYYPWIQETILIHNQYCLILLMCVFFIHARCCPSSLAKLVQITPISLWFMVDISILTMAIKKKNITRGHHLASTLVDAWFYDISWWDDHMIFFQPIFPRQQIWVWIKINPPKIDLVDTWRTVTWVPLVLWYSFFSASFFT